MAASLAALPAGAALCEGRRSIPVQSASKMIKMPRVIYSQPIPYFVEVKKIHASYEDRDLVIHMPFNGLYNGYHRKVTADN